MFVRIESKCVLASVILDCLGRNRKTLQGTLAKARPSLPTAFNKDKAGGDLVAGCYQ